MLLTYIDESGISYERLNQKGAFFVDGPFAIYGGMLIPDLTTSQEFRPI